jgi:hypothetical protein
MTSARFGVREIILGCLLFVLGAIAPMGCERDTPTPPGETFDEAVSRVRTNGLNEFEQRLADAIQNNLEPWEVTYLSGLDWSRLTAEGVAADPVFQHLFAVTDPVEATAQRDPSFWEISRAHAACEVAPGGAACAQGLIRALAPAITGGVLLSACGAIPFTLVGVPVGVACTAVALGILRNAGRRASECPAFAGRQLLNVYDCAVPDLEANDDYIDPAAACAARGLQLCPSARGCYATAETECRTVEPRDAGVSDAGVPTTDSGVEGCFPGEWVFDLRNGFRSPSCTRIDRLGVLGFSTALISTFGYECTTSAGSAPCTMECRDSYYTGDPSSGTGNFWRLTQLDETSGTWTKLNGPCAPYSAPMRRCLVSFSAVAEPTEFTLVGEWTSTGSDIGCLPSGLPRGARLLPIAGSAPAVELDGVALQRNADAAGDCAAGYFNGPADVGGDVMVEIIGPRALRVRIAGAGDQVDGDPCQAEARFEAPSM